MNLKSINIGKLLSLLALMQHAQDTLKGGQTKKEKVIELIKTGTTGVGVVKPEALPKIEQAIDVIVDVANGIK